MNDLLSGSQDWHGTICEALISALDCYPSAEMRFDHARRVEEAVTRWLATPGYKIEPLSQLETRIACLLHDVGPADWWPVASVSTRHERQEVIIDILKSANLGIDSGSRQRIVELTSLIDSSYARFPTNDHTTEHSAQHEPDSVNDSSVEVARLADALVHTTTECLNEAVNTWAARGLPPGSPVAHRISPLWHVSIAGNLVLQGIRTIIDTQTADAHLVTEALHNVEDLLDATWEPWREAHTALHDIRRHLLEASRVCAPGQRPTLRAVHSWTVLEATLRQVVLLHDVSIKPYSDVALTSTTTAIRDLTPTALYVIMDQIEWLTSMHNQMMASFGISIFDLGEMITVNCDGNTLLFAPPIVESYEEPDLGNTRIAAIVDGLHRCQAALSLGLDKVRVVMATDVSTPLVPLPVGWDEIVTYEKDAPGDDALMRRYRFNDRDSFPTEDYPSSMNVPEAELKYFFYRNLNAIGSSGRRNTGRSQ